MHSSSFVVAVTSVWCNLTAPPDSHAFEMRVLKALEGTCIGVGAASVFSGLADNVLPRIASGVGTRARIASSPSCTHAASNAVSKPAPFQGLHLGSTLSTAAMPLSNSVSLMMLAAVLAVVVMVCVVAV